MLRDNFSGIQTGFLGLRARLSQAWLSPPLIVLIIYIVKLLLLQKLVDIFLSLSFLAVKTECQAVKSVANDALQVHEESMLLANKVTNNAIKSATDAAVDSLKLTLTIAEKLILFAVEMTIGTYACLSLAAIDIAAGEAINATEAVVNFASNHAKSIGEDINSGLNDISKTINSAVGLLSSVENFIEGGNKEISQVNLTVSELYNFSVPSSINKNLERIRTEVPTYNSTKATVSNLVSKPFSYVKTQLTDANFSFEIKQKTYFDNSQQFQGCNITEISNAFDLVKRDIGYLVNVLCGLCGLAIALSIAYQLWSTTRRWNFLQETAAEKPTINIKDDLLRPDLVNMNRITLAESNFVGRFAFKHFSNKNRWLLEFLSQPPLVTFLLIGLAGVLLSGLEYGVLDILVSGAKTIAKLGSEAAKVASADISNVTQHWVQDTNQQISDMETSINTNILGNVYNGSQELNGTISTFMSSINGEIVDVFNNTFLLTPIQDTVQCLIGNKVDTIEKGLNWIHNKSKVALPRVSKAMLPNSTQSDLSTGSTDAKQTFENILESGIAYLKSQIKTQFIVSGVFLAVWVLFGLLIMLYLAFKEHPEWAQKLKFHPKAIAIPHIPHVTHAPHAPHVPKVPAFPRFKHNNPVSRKLNFTGLAGVNNDIGEPCPLPPRTPLQRFSTRITRFFNGPERMPSFSVGYTEHMEQHGSIHDPESPRTPLKAMLHKNLYFD